jgi:hypothetical protein
VTGSYYEIAVRGRLGPVLKQWFEDLEVRASGPDGTYLRGWFEDQAQLRSVLTELNGLGMEIRSVRRT